MALRKKWEKKCFIVFVSNFFRNTCNYRKNSQMSSDFQGAEKIMWPETMECKNICEIRDRRLNDSFDVYLTPHKYYCRLVFGAKVN